MMRQALRRAAQGAFWMLAAVALLIVLSLPANLSNLLFGSPV